MSTAIQTYEQGAYLTQWREPEEVLAEATKAAVALQKVVSMKKNPVIFNGEQYLEREDWGTVAKFYGCTAKTLETRYVEFGNERGFEAVAVVIDRNMNEIGRAESMCLTGEKNWGDVPVYKWEDELDEQGKKIWIAPKDGKKGYYKGKRVQDGTEPKPLFQLRSMAQTRAEAKALKGVFSWVVVLAGYRPSVAEEMTGNEQFEEREQSEKKPPVNMPARASEKKATQPAAQGQPLSQGQKTTADEFSGVIESAKAAKSNDGTIWLSGKNLLVMVPADKVDSDMKPGYFIKCRGAKKHSEKAGDYIILTALIELSPVQDGTPEPSKTETSPAKDAPLAPDLQQTADEIFGEKKKEAGVIEGMVENGTLKKASDLPATKSGTIGKKRAQRLYTIASQNKANNNGFNEAEMKKILQVMYPAWTEVHLSDMEVSFYEQFEKWAAGEEDWREYWKD